MIKNQQKEIVDISISLIKQFEGLSLNSYKCSANKNTIGYGHVILANENYKTITEKQAEEILEKDLDKFLKDYLTYIKVDLKANQHASLLSLMFNIGGNAFKNSTLLKLINSNADIEDVKYQFLRWKFIGKKESKGLLNRRLLEWENYIK